MSRLMTLAEALPWPRTALADAVGLALPLARWRVTPQALDTADAPTLLARAGFPDRFGEALSAADEGDPLAMSLIALACAEGTGIPADPVEARRWAARSGEAGEARGSRTLGVLLLYGQGGARDVPAALGAFERAHAQGNSLAAIDIALILHRGEGGIAADHIRAFALFSEGAAAGIARGHGGVAVAFFNGEGVAHDDHAAVAAAEAGAAAGDPFSHYLLGLAYDGGRGVTCDPERARAFMESAALGGHGEARARLGWDRGRTGTAPAQPLVRF